MMGAADQAPNSYLATAQGAGSLQPAYRGILGLVWRGGIVSANNPYVKPWSFRCKRITAGWDGAVWYPAKAAVDVSEVGTGALFAANPAHIIYECLTNSEWGLGYPAGTIDTVSFTSAADTFHAEAFGLCIQWSRQESIQNFIQLVCDHAGAALSQDVRTGLWRLRAIRDDYDLEELPVFSEENGTIMTMESFERASPSETINELTIKFSDILLAKNGAVTVHHLANITSQGYVVAQTQEYPGIPTHKIAARIAERDIRTFGSTIARVRFYATRAAYGLLPGDVIRFSWPRLGIQSMVLRIGKINYGTLTEGRIEIEAVEDSFGLPLNSYLQPPPLGWQPPNTTPSPAEHYTAFEIPYREIAATEGAANAAALPSTSGYIAGVARKPPVLSFSFELRTKIGAAAYEEQGEGPWTPTATLAANLSRTATTVQLSNAIDLDQVDTGTACLIGTEIVRIDAVNTGTNTITVGRGCADTVPQAWATGTRVWFYDSWAVPDQTEYVLGDVVDAKFVTITGTGELAEGSAPTSTVTLNRRAARPYPPGLFRINGAAYPATAYARLALTWAHRDRLVQQDDLIDQGAVSIGPEAGTTYTVRIYQQPSTLLHTQTGITGTALTYEHELNADLRVEVEAVRDGLASWQIQSHVITCTGGTVVVNGSFAADTDWTKGTRWTIAAGVATKAAGTASDLSQAVAFVAGGVYLVEFTVSGYSAGTVLARFVGGAPVSGGARSANGTYTQELTAASGNNALHFVADSAFAGSIDAVRVRRVA
jgi:hypothetical protein